MEGKTLRSLAIEGSCRLSERAKNIVMRSIVQHKIRKMSVLIVFAASDARAHLRRYADTILGPNTI
jgi:hypothetical protein